MKTFSVRLWTILQTFSDRHHLKETLKKAISWLAQWFMSVLTRLRQVEFRTIISKISIWLRITLPELFVRYQIKVNLLRLWNWFLSVPSRIMAVEWSAFFLRVRVAVVNTYTRIRKEGLMVELGAIQVWLLEMCQEGRRIWLGSTLKTRITPVFIWIQGTWVYGTTSHWIIIIFKFFLSIWNTFFADIYHSTKIKVDNPEEQHENTAISRE